MTYLYLAALFAIGIYALVRGHERNVPELSDDALDEWASDYCGDGADAPSDGESTE